MNKKLFLVLVIIMAIVFMPNVYAGNLTCELDDTAKATCEANFDAGTNKATVVVTLKDYAVFGTPTLVKGENEVDAVETHEDSADHKTRTYTITNADATTKVKPNVTFEKFTILAPECPTGHGTVEVEPSGEVEYREPIVIRTRPADCYEVDEVVVKGVTTSTIVSTVAGSGGLYNFTMPAENVTITVKYKAMATCDEEPATTATPTATPTPTPTGDVKVPDTDTYSYLTTFVTLLVISSVGFVLYKKVS